MSDDGLQIVITRLPFERRADTVAGGDGVRRIACLAGRKLHLEVDARYALHGFDHETTAITTSRGGAATAQISKRIGVGGDEIGNVNIIPDMTSTRCSAISAATRD